MGHFLKQEKKTSEQTDTQLERQTVSSPAGLLAVPRDVVRSDLEPNTEKEALPQFLFLSSTYPAH